MVDIFFKGSSVFYLTTHMCVKDEENLLSTQQVFLKCLLWAKQYNSYWYTVSKQMWTLTSWSFQSHGGEHY